MAFCTAISLCNANLSLPDFQPLLQHLAGRFFVLIERMGIDVQRGGRLTVAQQTRYRGHVRAVGNQQAGVGVSQEWTFSFSGRPFFFRISFIRQVKELGVMGN